MRVPYTMEFGATQVNAAGTRYLGKNPADTNSATENQRQRLAPVNGPGATFHIKAMRITCATAPGGAVVDSYRVRINGVNQGPAAVTVTGAAVTGYGPVGVSASEGQLISVSVAGGVGGAPATFPTVILEGEIVTE